MKLQNLKTTAHCGFCECIRQSWNNTDTWTGYTDNPRPSNAFVLVCSNMQIQYKLFDGKTVTAKRGDVVFIPKGLRYSGAFLGGGSDPDSYTINFLLFDDCGKEIVIEDDICVLENKADEGCFFLAEELFKAHINRQNDSIKPQIRFYELLEKICELSSGAQRYYYPIRKGVELLIKEYAQNKKIDYYAKICNMDKSYFYKLFKAWSGISPNEYRNRLRITVAKSMLAASNLTVYQIAEKTGFVDPYYFSRIFKKEVGTSPAKYRRISQ